MKRCVELAIVLCSVFLVALPAAGISADQNQALQQVNASGVTKASEEYDAYQAYGSGHTTSEAVIFCGGINIFDDIED